jgi:hypothetical protein
MKLPPLRDFVRNTNYLQRHYPRSAAIREHFCKEYLAMIPFFYVIVYPVLFIMFWLFSSPFSKLVANMGYSFFTGFSRYEGLSTVSALAEHLRTDMMSIVLLPVSIPKSVFSSLAGTSVGEMFGALLSLFLVLLFLGGLIILSLRFLLSAGKIIARFFMC